MLADLLARPSPVPQALRAARRRRQRSNARPTGWRRAAMTAPRPGAPHRRRWRAVEPARNSLAAEAHRVGVGELEKVTGLDRFAPRAAIPPPLRAPRHRFQVGRRRLARARPDRRRHAAVGDGGDRPNDHLTRHFVARFAA